MRISVFGNPDLPGDNLPLRLAVHLRQHFPQHEFIHQDPHEECRPVEKEEWWIIDTMRGIDEVKLFTDISKIKSPRWLSMHDYDLSMELRLVKKIYPDLRIRIIGIPEGADWRAALQAVINLLPN